MAENETNREGGTTVYVDDQPVTVEESELTIRRLLELAGAPADAGGDGEAVLRELRGGQEIKHENLEETITVSEEARFYTRNAPSGGEQGDAAFKSESANLETGTRSKSGDVNTSSFGGGGSRGERAGQAGGREAAGPTRSETPGGRPADLRSSSPNVSKEPRGPNVGASQQPPARNLAGRPTTPDTSTQRGSTAGSNVASGTGVRREPDSSDRGTNPGQGMQNPKSGAGGTEQARQGFNEGENQQPGSRRSGERTEGRPGEKKREEQKT